MQNFNTNGTLGARLYEAFVEALTQERLHRIAEAFAEKCAGGDVQAFRVVSEVLASAVEVGEEEGVSLNEKAEIIRKAAEALAELGEGAGAGTQ